MLFGWLESATIAHSDRIRVYIEVDIGVFCARCFGIGHHLAVSNDNILSADYCCGFGCARDALLWMT